MKLPKFIKIEETAMKLQYKLGNGGGFYWRDSGKWGYSLSLKEIQQGFINFNPYFSFPNAKITKINEKERLRSEGLEKIVIKKIFYKKINI